MGDLINLTDNQIGHTAKQIETENKLAASSRPVPALGRNIRYNTQVAAALDYMRLAASHLQGAGLYANDDRSRQAALQCAAAVFILSGDLFMKLEG